jgi:hypothetical protein
MRAPLPTLLLSLLAATIGAAPADGPFANWKHHGALPILTDAAGVDLPATTTVEGFPLLVRLQGDWFPFAEAKPRGEDLRFTDGAGQVLPHQIESWQGGVGNAAVWVRIPRIVGQQRQLLHLHWGKAEAPDASSGPAVFGEDNGYLTVWHLDDPTADATGKLTGKDTGTKPTAGVIGAGRAFPGKAGIFAGDKIAGFPTGSQPHSTEVWFRAAQPNASVVGWGNEQRQGKMVLQYRSPSHVRTDCYFSAGNVASRPFPAGEWVHVMHVYTGEGAKIYVNGEPAELPAGRAGPMNVTSPARLWIGGWYHNYEYVGDIDEVRVSKVARSAAWAKLSYANQRPEQRLHGLLTPGGTGAPSVTPAAADVPEGGRLTLRLAAPGALQVTWLKRQEGRETVLATNRLACDFEAGRTVGDAAPTEVVARILLADRSVEVASRLTVREAIPEPKVHLAAAEQWDGVSPLDVTMVTENQAAMKLPINVRWLADTFAVTQEARGTSLHLRHAQRDGELVVRATVDNGGAPTVAETKIRVKRPADLPRHEREAAPEERPQDHQFFGRGADGLGWLRYSGKVDRPGAKVTLTVTADGQPYRVESATGETYAFKVGLRPGFVRYHAKLTSELAGTSVTLHEAEDLVAGRAYLIAGQSNAVATDWGKGEATYRNEWIRTYGTTSTNPRDTGDWGAATHRAPAGKLAVGYWAMELGRRLVESEQVPVCFINGAVGGTRIDQHQRNPADPTDGSTIYGRMLARVRAAHLTHEVEAIFWYQGENDQGADGPGGFGYERYREYFHQLAGAWSVDYPNVRRYYLFQIWPKSCAMGIDGSDNRLREVLRRLPEDFAGMTIQATLGIEPPGGCHYPPEGYAEMANQLYPVVASREFGRAFPQPVTAPNLRASRLDANGATVTLTFDQPMRWDDSLCGQFWIDGVGGEVTGGQAEGTTVTLRLKSPRPNGGGVLTYLDSKAWSQKTLLRGVNGLAALTFCEVPLTR